MMKPFEIRVWDETRAFQSRPKQVPTASDKNTNATAVFDRNSAAFRIHAVVFYALQTCDKWRLFVLLPKYTISCLYSPVRVTLKSRDVALRDTLFYLQSGHFSILSHSPRQHLFVQITELLYPLRMLSVCCLCSGTVTTRWPLTVMINDKVQSLTHLINGNQTEWESGWACRSHSFYAIPLDGESKDRPSGGSVLVLVSSRCLLQKWRRTCIVELWRLFCSLLKCVYC